MAFAAFYMVTLTINVQSATSNTISINHSSDSVIYKQNLLSLQSQVPLSYNKYVQKVIENYKSQKSRFLRMIELSDQYFPIYESIFRERNVPEEIKYLSVVESSLNPNAVSKCGATGPWQFLYEVGKIYGLKINTEVDERKDPALACKAAATYLLDSYHMFGNDWLIAIASYNCGRNNIRWAIEEAGGKTDYWSIRKYLPIETQNYVPAYIATVYLMNTLKKSQEPVDNNIFVNTRKIPVARYISLEDIAKISNLDLSKLKSLNPAFSNQQVRGTSRVPVYVTIPSITGPLFNELYKSLNGIETTASLVEKATNSQ